MSIYEWGRETDKYVLFWGGVYSNWIPSEFEINVSGVKDLFLKFDTVTMRFCTSEQYMMAVKAILFKDWNMFDEIMGTDDPQKQKAFGRKIKGYSDEVWDPVARDMTYPGVYAKFKQNERLRKVLLASSPKKIVEASPYDTKWGIGMHFDEEGVEDETNWKGRNWLGHVLMQVREDLEQGVDRSFQKIDWSKWE